MGTLGSNLDEFDAGLPSGSRSYGCRRIHPTRNQPGKRPVPTTGRLVGGGRSLSEVALDG